MRIYGLNLSSELQTTKNIMKDYCVKYLKSTTDNHLIFCHFLHPPAPCLTEQYKYTVYYTYTVFCQ